MGGKGKSHEAIDRSIGNTENVVNTYCNLWRTDTDKNTEQKTRNAQRSTAWGVASYLIHWATWAPAAAASATLLGTARVHLLAQAVDQTLLLLLLRLSATIVGPAALLLLLQLVVAVEGLIALLLLRMLDTIGHSGIFMVCDRTESCVCIYVHRNQYEHACIQ